MFKLFKKAKYKKSMLYLTLLIIILSFIVGSFALISLYKTSLNIQSEHLLDVVLSQTNILETTLQYGIDSKTESNSEVSTDKILIGLIKSYIKYINSRESGEIVLAKRFKDEIIYLIPYKEGRIRGPESVDFNSPSAEAMKLALLGGTGLVRHRDYRGVEVISGYSYIDSFSLGLIFQLDIKEIREPFIRSYIIIIITFILFITAGLLVYKRLFKPFYETLESKTNSLQRVNLELKNSEFELRRILKYLPLPVLIIDKNNRVVFINKMLQSKFGYNLKELEEDLWEKCFPDEDYRLLIKQLWMNAFESVRHSDKNVDMEEWTIWCKDGSKRLCEFYMTPIGDNSLVLLNDITRKKQLEKELIEAKLSAEMASDAKSKFLANMSHEIRTPMNGILGMTILLLDTTLDLRQRKLAEIIKVSGDSLMALLNNILDFSKNESGKLVLEAIDFNLYSFLEQLVDLFKYRAEEKGLELILRHTPDVPIYLTGDPGRVRQVLMNLVGNSFKFTDNGYIEISIELKERLMDLVILTFSVTDTGIGIPQSRIGDLFNHFTQVDASTTRKYGGSGLGLAITKQLVEAMGGRISCLSDEGVGSTFSFDISFKTPVMNISKYKTGVEDLRSLNILIVDDKTANIEVLKLQLESWGLRVKSINSREDILKYMLDAYEADDPFNIVILDMKIGFIDGIDLGIEIKKNEKLVNTSLIMITSSGSKGDVEKVKKAGFRSYLTRPVNRVDLKEVILTIDSEEDLNEQKVLTKHLLREIRWSKKEILIAEDNKINQKVAVGILKNLGIEPDVVKNGNEVIVALTEKKYDIVFMDCQMPEMDGYDATRKVRDHKSVVLDHDTIIIAMTANVMPEDRERCLQAGMNDYLAKPVNPQKIKEMLKKWLKERHI